MELVKTILRLRFSEAISPWLEMRSIIRGVGESQSAEIAGTPLVMELKDKKQRVVLQVKAFEFIQEGMKSIEDSIDIAVDKLVKSNSASKLPNIDQVSYESIFIEPYAVPFHELLLLMKNRFLQPGALVDSTTDFGLIFDQMEGDILKHYLTGPMVKEQLLKMYLHYGRDQIPDNFVFLSLQYQQNKDFAFDVDYVRKFLQTAGQWQTHQAKSVFSYLKKGED
ncbi:hypothetical protein ES703_60955 [subsurface metagenome]